MGTADKVSSLVSSPPDLMYQVFFSSGKCSALLQPALCCLLRQCQFTKRLAVYTALCICLVEAPGKRSVTVIVTSLSLELSRAASVFHRELIQLVARERCCCREKGCETGGTETAGNSLLAAVISEERWETNSARETHLVSFLVKIIKTEHTFLLLMQGAL